MSRPRARTALAAAALAVSGLVGGAAGAASGALAATAQPAVLTTFGNPHITADQAVLASTRSAAGSAGTRDVTFGNGGIVVTNLGADPFGNAIQGNVSAAALQSNGDIVVSVVNNATGDSGLLRYLPNGTRDTTFGNGGFAAFPAGAGVGSFLPKLAVQSDDKILAATAATASNGSGAFGVVRFNANGTVDQGFGHGGVAASMLQDSGVQGAQEVLVQPDGKILAGGEALSSTVEGKFDGGLVRFNADGSVDQGFGTGGQVLVRNDPFTTLGLDASGDIFTLSVGPGATKAVRLEFSPAGRQDASVTPAAITASSRGSLAGFLPSGGFVISGEAFPDGFRDGDLQVSRFNPDGSLASATVPFDWGQTFDPRSDGAGALAIQANGQALVSEGGRLGAQKVARYNADGSFDAGFGVGGVASTQVQDNDSAAVLLTQPDGKILAIGSAQNTTTGVVDVLLVRYLAS
jgi:uncharacterized delta-60 repeat protein